MDDNQEELKMEHDVRPLKRWSQYVSCVTGLKATEHIRECYDTILAYLNATDEVNGQLSADQSLFTRTHLSIGDRE